MAHAMSIHVSLPHHCDSSSFVPWACQLPAKHTDFRKEHETFMEIRNVIVAHKFGAFPPTNHLQIEYCIYFCFQFRFNANASLIFLKITNSPDACV